MFEEEDQEDWSSDEGGEYADWDSACAGLDDSGDEIGPHDHRGTDECGTDEESSVSGADEDPDDVGAH